nr:HU family DNA-binding protein [uncultured Porphyromonas sp.]
MFMNKTDFIAGVAEKAGLTKEQARKAVDAFAAVVAEELQKGEKVSLLGFGTFSVQDKPAREGINPATKAKIKIPARKAVKFKAGAALDLNA